MSKYLITNEQQVRDTFTQYTKDLDPRINEWYQKVFYRHLLRNAHLKPVEHGSSFNHAVGRLERYPKQYFDDRPQITKALEDAVDVLRTLTPTVFNHEYGKAWSSLSPTQVKAITEVGMIPVQMEAFTHHSNGAYPTGKDRYVMLARLEMAKDSLPKFFKQMNEVLVSLLDGDKRLNAFNVDSVLDHLASMIRTKHVDSLALAGHTGPNAKVIYTHGEYEFVHLSSLDAVGCAGMQLSNCLRDSTQHYFNKGMVIGLRKIGKRVFTSAFTLVRQANTPKTAPKYINELESVFEGFARNIVTDEERQAVVDYVTENGWHSLVTGEIGVNMPLVEDHRVEAKHRTIARERQDVLLKQHAAEIEVQKHLPSNWVSYDELQLPTITDTTGRYSLRSQMFNRIRPQPVITPVRTNADGTPTATPRRTLVNYPIQTYAVTIQEKLRALGISESLIDGDADAYSALSAMFEGNQLWVERGVPMVATRARGGGPYFHLDDLGVLPPAITPVQQELTTQLREFYGDLAERGYSDAATNVEPFGSGVMVTSIDNTPLGVSEVRIDTGRIPVRVAQERNAAIDAAVQSNTEEISGAAVMRTVPESVSLSLIEPQTPVPIAPISDVAVLTVQPDYGTNITELLETARESGENVSVEVVAQTNNGLAELTVTGPRHLVERIQAGAPDAYSMAARVEDVPRSNMGIIEMSWMPGDDSQSQGRLHRAGRVSSNPAVFGMMYGQHRAGHMRRFIEKRDAMVTREQIAAVVKLQREFAKPDTGPKHILLKPPKPMTHACEYIADTLRWDQQVQMREIVRQDMTQGQFGEMHGMTIIYSEQQMVDLFGRPDFATLDSIPATSPMIVDAVRVPTRVHDSEVSTAPVGGKTALARELARKMGLKTIEIRPRSRGPQSRNFWQR